MQLKNTKGKTPVLEICALDKIKSGAIKVVLDIKKFLSDQVELVNGKKLDIDSVRGKWLLATGYHHNVPSWLQEGEFSPRIVFQRHRFQMGGKEIVGSMQLGSLGEGSLVHPQIP
ncbi:putative indole-3-pyruvate monooxygenase YUCCA9 [Castanea sativa]|uniref:putative indole-3-pyruvate monooxygenase YUCCA9 n=1 Tax=Castanea sativa TaxID=21020 RepID=UPI003F64BFFD